MNTLNSKVALTVLGVPLLTLLCGCGAQPAPSATSIQPTSTPMPSTAQLDASNNSQEALRLLDNAQQAMRTAKTYHFTQEMFGIYDGRRGTSEGDMSTREWNARIKYDNQMLGHGEAIVFDGGKDVYLKIAGNSGYIAEGSNDNILPGAITIFLDPLQLNGHPRTTRDARLAGEEMLNGLSTIKVTFTIYENHHSLRGNERSSLPVPTEVPGQPPMSESSLPARDSHAEVWIEKGTNYIVRFRETTRYQAKDYPGIPATPEAGGEAGTGSVAWPMTWTFSNFNKEIDPPIERPTNIMPTPTQEALEELPMLPERATPSP